MLVKEILATVNLAHQFDSAFTSEQVYRYLRVKTSREFFDKTLAQLQTENQIFEKHNALFTKNLCEIYQQKKRWSRALFSRHRPLLWLLSRMPWVNYISLTGANAFESCQRRDDIDLFLITAKDRLWICYTLLVIFSKIFRKRSVLCLNYLVDENNLRIAQCNYFTAVQILQMLPLCQNDLGEQLIRQNDWIFDFLPNAQPRLFLDQFYTVKNGKYRASANRNGFLGRLNRWIFRNYAVRLRRKYPEKIGSGIVLQSGIAKLNSIDHQDIYETFYRQIDAELAHLQCLSEAKRDA